jgi:hypothetical protein
MYNKKFLVGGGMDEMAESGWRACRAQQDIDDQRACRDF